MKASSVQVWVLALVFVFVGSVAATAVNVSTTPQKDVGGPTPKVGLNPKTVLVQLFTSSTCPPCATQDPAFSRIVDEYPPDQMVAVAYHCNWPTPGNDPYYDASILTPLRTFYGVNSAPSFIVDGGGTSTAQWIMGAWSPSSANYQPLRQKIDQARILTSELTISLKGDLTPSGATVTATITATDMPSQANLQTKMVLYQDPLYYMGTNSEPLHRVVARAVHYEPLTISIGQTVTTSYTFSPNPAWDKNRMGVVVYVQTDDRKSWSSGGYTYYNAFVLQAAKLQFVKPNVLFMPDAGSVADYTEYMEKPLSEANRAFETYNTIEMGDSGTVDGRAPLPLYRMEEYGAVIWNTGGEVVDTLNMGERTLIRNYMDSINVNGNVFVQGRGIGSETSSADPNFLKDYFKTSFGGTSVAAFINGNASDPITSAWSATNLAITGSPSDVADPYPGGTVPVVYPGMMNAGVKSTYDVNSRALYFGANYFGSTDARKTQMADNILNWLDGAAGPKARVVAPNGGEEYSPGDMVEIKWSAIDVEIPVDGVDVYYTISLLAPNWIQLTSAEPNDGVYMWNVPAVQTTDCGVKIVVRDGDMMTPDTEAVSAGPCKIGFPDISITKDVSNPTPQSGEVITYTITLTNTGTLAGYATALDTLPSGVLYQSDDGGMTGASGYDGTNTTAYWTVAVPAMSNMVWNIQVLVTASGPGTLVKNWASFNSTSASGGSQQSGNDQADFQIPALENWQLPLSPGQRLISIPILLSDYRVEVVLASIAGSYSYVRQFQATDPTNPWKSYDPLRTYNSMTHIRPETGFWIEVTSATTLNLVGARAGSTQIVLMSGWNMVGYPSLATGYTVADMKASIGLPGIVVEGFDATTGPYYLKVLPDSYVLNDGEGYWVRVPAIGMWNVAG